MSWTISGSEKRDVAGIENVSLLLHGNGADGSTTITDSSPTPKTVTAVGDAKISTAQSKFGGASIAFDGNGDYLSIPTSSAFDFGSSDFTIECWVYANTAPGAKNIIGNYATSQNRSSFVIQTLAGSNLINCVVYVPGSFVQANSFSAFPSGQWNHIAFVRSGSSFVCYLNGTGGTSTTSTSTVRTPTNPIVIGAEENSYYWNGYIDDLRITKGVARYTSNFTPPTAPFPDI